MEPFNFESGKLKGVETLYFEDVEVQKTKGDATSFSSMGPLSVLYFKNFDRFVLKLNGWTYPLMRRIPITADGKTFSLPAPNGFTYKLIFNNPSTQAFSNLETILSNNAKFGDRKLSASPDDKIGRKVSGHREVTVAGLIKAGVDKVKEVTKDLTATKKKPITKKRLMPDSIKNKNFKKEAKATFKKNYFETEKALTKKFNEHRTDNVNLKDIKEIADLKKTTDKIASTLFLKKEGVEEAIIRQKDLIKARSFVADKIEKKGIADTIKEGIAGVKQSVQGMMHREAPRVNTNTETSQPSLVEGNAHYHA